VCILPVGFDGAFAVWPRRHLLPWPIGKIDIVVGEPIPAGLIACLDDGQLLAELDRRLRACFWEAQQRRRRRWI
jgi:hypothetical protein